MNRKALVLVVVGFIGFFFLPSRVTAQQASQRWVCLKYTLCGNLTDEPKCTFTKDGGTLQNRYYHTVRVSTKEGSDKKLVPNKETYIVEIVQIPDWLVIPDAIKAKYTPIPTEVRTTGNSEIDKLLFDGNDNHTTLKELFSGYNGGNGYQFDGYYAPDLKTQLSPENANHYFMSTNQGEFPNTTFMYTSHTWVYPHTVERKIMAVNLLDDSNLGDVEYMYGQKQGTFDFEAQYNDKDCVKIAWDPYGRIFDSQTLEPLPNVVVWLYRKNTDGTYQPAGPEDTANGVLNNPVTTMEDGKFSFLTTDGVYQLRPISPGYAFEGVNYQYTFPNDPTKLSTKNFYINLNRGEDIVEKGKPVQANVPVDPVNSLSYPTAPRIMGSFVQQDKNNSSLVNIDGTVSHPYAMVKAYCVNAFNVSEKKTYLTSKQANEDGDFFIGIDQSKCPEGELWGMLEPEKVDLIADPPEEGARGFFETVLALFDPVVAVAEAAKLIPPTPKGVPRIYPPIPTNLVGYAYNGSNSIIPYANVSIYEYGALKPAYTVRADQNGYFAINPEHIPPWSYYLKYAGASGKPLAVSTSKFVAQNHTYLRKNSVELFANTHPVLTGNSSSQSQVFVKRAESPTVAVAQGGGSNYRNAQTGDRVDNKDMLNPQGGKPAGVNLALLPVIFFLILLIGAAGAIVFFYMKKQKGGQTFM